MEILLVAILSAVAAVAATIVYLQSRTAEETAPDPLAGEIATLRDEMREVARSMSTDADRLSNRLESRLEGIDTRMTQTQTASATLARGIFDTLGEVKSATQTVAEQAQQFTLLQDLLKPPKARGGLGEALLEELLRQVLPPSAFGVQYRFTSGVVVDAVVRLADRLVCIDSKFPLANYRRICDADNETDRVASERAFAGDVARHINDIATRYIVPDEDTFDFAVMYVPAEGIYAEVLRLSHRQQPLFETALAARVIPMSPLTMYGYLQTIAFGLKCLGIEKSAERILDFCGRLQQDMERFVSEYDVLGRHLSNARSKYEEGARKLDRFRTKLDEVAEIGDDEEDARPSLEVVGDY